LSARDHSVLRPTRRLSRLEWAKTRAIADSVHSRRWGRLEWAEVRHRKVVRRAVPVLCDGAGERAAVGQADRGRVRRLRRVRRARAGQAVAGSPA
jgi:hypothetical protein